MDDQLEGKYCKYSKVGQKARNVQIQMDQCPVQIETMAI